MAKLMKFFLLVLLIGGLLAAGSYGAGYLAQGKLVGAQPLDLGAQQTRFATDGIPDLPGAPKAWVFSYGPTKIPGMPQVEIYVSPTGSVLGTKPKNFVTKLQAYRAAQTPE
ncbi:MAG: hypothetical protein ACHQXA_00555 [Gemmatimonadales bacterium]